MIQKQAIVFLALFHLAANAEIYSSVVASSNVNEEKETHPK